MNDTQQFDKIGTRPHQINSPYLLPQLREEIDMVRPASLPQFGVQARLRISVNSRGSLRHESPALPLE